MLSCDGFAGNLECLTTSDIKEKALELFSSFDPIKDDNLRTLEALGNTSITEETFCSIIGRLRLYQALPNQTRADLGLPNLTFGDQVVNAVVRGYIENPSFKKEDDSETITLFCILQLYTEAIKATYIDRWLDRERECVDFVLGIQRAIEGSNPQYAWFLQ